MLWYSTGSEKKITTLVNPPFWLDAPLPSFLFFSPVFVPCEGRCAVSLLPLSFVSLVSHAFPFAMNPCDSFLCCWIFVYSLRVVTGFGVLECSNLWLHISFCSLVLSLLSLSLWMLTAEGKKRCSKVRLWGMYLNNSGTISIKSKTLSKQQQKKRTQQSFQLFERGWMKGTS